MSGVRTMSWYMAVAVLTVATFIGWKSALAIAANAVHDQSEFCRTIVEPLGYLCAEYRTYSADGYELVVHRVGSRRRERLDGSPLSRTKETDQLSQTRVEALPRKVQLPIHRSRQRSLTDSRTEGKHDKYFPFLEEEGENPHSSGGRPHDHRSNAIVAWSVVTSSNGADLPTVSEGPATKGEKSESPGPVYSPPTTSDRHAPVPSPSPSVAVPKVAAISASSPSLSHDQNSEDLMIISGSGKVPVLIMHQEFLNGDSWFQFTDAGDRLLPLLLVDAGFDVWIGHERATYWGHGHLSLREDDKRYWDWTWDEHAKYDVPALLELINIMTGFSAHYVGISQSATVGAAAATMPENSQFMRSLTLIGPTIYRACSSIALEAWAFVYGNTIDRTYYNEGHQNGAFNFSREFNVTVVIAQGTVGQELGTISGPNCCLGSAVIPFTNGWDGTTSYKNLIHDQQGIRTSFWRHYDYGRLYNNTQAYGVPFPPHYLPEQIPSHIPVLVVYGGQDAYAPVAGMRYLLSRLGTRSKSVYVPAYAHYDLSYSVNRTRDVFIPILQFLEAHRWD